MNDFTLSSNHGYWEIIFFDNYKNNLKDKDQILRIHLYLRTPIPIHIY